MDHATNGLDLVASTSETKNPPFQTGPVNGVHMNGRSGPDLDELESELPVVVEGQVCRSVLVERTC